MGMRFLILFFLFEITNSLRNKIRHKKGVSKLDRYIASLLNHKKADDILKRYSIRYGKSPEMLASNNNEVYKLTCKNKSFILKKFLTDDFQDENKIALSIKFPKILGIGDDFRLENYIKHEKINYQVDMEKIATAVLAFQKLKLDRSKVTLPDYKSILSKQLEVQTGYLMSLLHKPEFDKDLKAFEPKDIVAVLCNAHQSMIRLMDRFNLKCDTLCHNDLNVGNILKVKDLVFFIDFECACLNDPLLEIGRFFYCAKYFYYYNHQQDIQNLWNDQKRLEFLQHYYKTKDPTFLRAQLVKIDSLTVVTNFFYFLTGLTQVRQPPLARATRRFQSLEGHFERIKEYGILNSNEILIITRYIEFLKTLVFD